MKTDASIREQGYQYFLQEAPELLQILEEGLLTLREDSSINKVNTLMRATHTLKGSAACLELETITNIAHSMEDIFRALCRPEVSIGKEVEALLFEGCECLRLALMAELTDATVNDEEVLNQTATIFAQLQAHLGDCFDQDTPPPTSAELGFDVTQSIFEVGVTQRLDQLAAVLETAQAQEILSVLKTQADVFLGLGESLKLSGFREIAQATIAALEHHPEQVVSIAHLALQDFQAGQAAVLAGDRTQGGYPSEARQRLAEPQRDT
ncbi:MAG: hybrid sensor histidine kinase/response regulator, partial [Leptolyngbya sp. SIO1D8]|nr:hybrid sensor histidine kinase/response regulator [Leptolyngbya sp. SIO1D8]